MGKFPIIMATLLEQNARIEQSGESFREAVTQFLGSGSFGFVFKIKTEEGDRAVKTSFPSDFDVDVNMRAKREYDAVKGLPRHENVVTIYNFVAKALTSEEILHQFHKPNLLDSETEFIIEKYAARARYDRKIMTTYLEMELCGLSLRSWLVDEGENNCPDVQTEIVRGLVGGTKFLHDNNVMHRDLKPSNIMFSLSPSTGCKYNLPVKIGDFGCSRFYSQEDEDRTKLTSTMGTFAYAAPEVMSRNYGSQADLFSLGLIIWEVLQRLPLVSKAMYFDRLVNDRETGLVQGHAIIANAKDLIVSLTHRRTTERMKSINDVELIINPIHDKYIASADSLSDESPFSSMELCSSLSPNLVMEQGSSTQSNKANPGQIEPKDVEVHGLRFNGLDTRKQAKYNDAEQEEDISQQPTSTSQPKTFRAYLDAAEELDDPDRLKEILSLMEARLGSLKTMLQSQSFKNPQELKTFINKL